MHARKHARMHARMHMYTHRCKNACQDWGIFQFIIILFFLLNSVFQFNYLGLSFSKLVLELSPGHDWAALYLLISYSVFLYRYIFLECPIEIVKKVKIASTLILENNVIMMNNAIAAWLNRCVGSTMAVGLRVAIVLSSTTGLFCGTWRVTKLPCIVRANGKCWYLLILM